MSEKHVNEMTETELADHYYDHRYDPDLVDEAVTYTSPLAARMQAR